MIMIKMIFIFVFMIKSEGDIREDDGFGMFIVMKVFVIMLINLIINDVILCWSLHSSLYYYYCLNLFYLLFLI